LSTEKSRAIAKFALFADVGSSDCDAIISSAREKRFARRETIFSEGDPVRYVIMLISGLVKSSRLAPTVMKLCSLNVRAELLCAPRQH
jgi:CRP-like cAMP-binding protein